MREQVEKLRAQRKLTDEQASAVDVRAIVRFLRSDLAARIRKNAQTVRREYRFSLLRPVRDFATLDADDAVLLQGVVDCFLKRTASLWSWTSRLTASEEHRSKNELSTTALSSRHTPWPLCA